MSFYTEKNELVARPVKKKQLNSLIYVKKRVIERRYHEVQKGLHCDEIIGVSGGTITL